MRGGVPSPRSGARAAQCMLLGKGHHQRRTKVTVSSLRIYPVKSCQGIPVEEAQVDLHGFVNDRRFMFVDGNHTFLSQRRFPQMATIRATQLPDHSLQLDAPNMEPLIIPCPSSPSSNNNDDDDEIQVDVWDHKVSAVDQGEAAASWISTYLDTMGARLVKMGPSFQRMAHPSIPGPQVSFADDGPILLVSEPSLRDLNERLTQNGNAAVPVDRFRANIVVRQEEGDDGDELKPYGEDEWLVVEIGEVKFMVYKACSRCQIIGINQQTGEEVKRGGPLAALRRYRARGGNIAYADFGQLMMQLNEGKLKVGDEVKILERKQQ